MTTGCSASEETESDTTTGDASVTRTEGPDTAVGEIAEAGTVMGEIAEAGTTVAGDATGTGAAPEGTCCE